MDAPAAGRRTDAKSPAHAAPAAQSAALAVSVLVPACLAASQIGNVADAAHDAGLARVVGLNAEPWRALDVVVGALFAAAPLGTPSARAAAGGALVLGASGATLYALTRQLLGACTPAPRLGALVAATASASALVAPMWQLEGATPGGAATGALLILLPVALLAACQRGQGGARGGQEGKGPPEGALIGRWGVIVATLWLALGYEPLVGATSLGASAVFLWASPSLRRSLAATLSAPVRVGAAPRAPASAGRMGMAACAIAAVAPLLIALVRTGASGASLTSLLADAWPGERGLSLAGSPVALLRREVGWLGGMSALGGLGLAMFVSEARALSSALAAVVILGLLSGWAEPLGPTRFGAPVLASGAAAWGLAAVAMQAAVRAVAKARVPFSRSSAALVVVLECAIPVQAADETLLRISPRAAGSAAAWDDCVWGLLPAHTAVLVTDRRLYTRALAARAAGSLRADLALLPSFAPNAPGAPGPERRAVLAGDDALVPLLRDLALTGKPSEGSLASLAATRPLAMAFEPRWGRALVRHLVPLSLLDRFEPEPRGANDRRRALERFKDRREQLARICAHDPELASAAAYLLRARALALATNGDHDRDALALAAEDIDRFAPGDSVAAAVAARAGVSRPGGAGPGQRGAGPDTRGSSFGTDAGGKIDDLQP